MEGIDPLSVWWADVKLETKIDGTYYVTKKSIERPVLIIDNKAYLVFKITSRLQREGYKVKDLSSAGLYMDSIIRTDILVPLSENDLKHRMGSLSDIDKEGLSAYLKTQKHGRIMGTNQQY